MSLADSIDEGDLSPYALFDSWEAVEVEQRRRAREDRLALDVLTQDHTLLQMQSYVAHELLRVALLALTAACEEIGRLRLELDYRAFLDNQGFATLVERERS